MDLWIRSQDKMKLIYNPKLFIEVLSDCVWIEDISDSNSYWKLAEYSTKERALEVLDEIQKFIEEFQSVTAELNEYGEVTNVEHHKKVYEIPKE